MSRLIIEVHSTQVDVRSGNSKATGKPYEINTQVAWIRLLGQPFPTQIKINLEDASKPLQPGIYSFDPAQILKVGSFNAPELDDRQLEMAMKFEKELPKAS